MTVSEYLINYATFLDSRWFGEIDDGHRSLDPFYDGGEKRLTRDGAWLKRWKHCGRMYLATLPTVGVNTDMKILRCREEED